MIYLMHEIHYNLDTDWYNVYPYKNKDYSFRVYF